MNVEKLKKRKKIKIRQIKIHMEMMNKILSFKFI